MAGEQNENFDLELLVDDEENRVVVAVASREFIDTLFSFLTLPLGTIIGLVFRRQQQDQLAEVVCINNLYHSVNTFSDEVFWNPICKQMLLHPRNPCESICQKLKLNVDSTKPSTYFMCSGSCGVGSERCLSTFEVASYCSCGVKLLAKPSRYFMCRSSYEVRSERFLSAFEGASCCSYGKLMNKEVKLLEDPREEPHGDGAFVKGKDKYLVFDDLKVLQISPANFAKELAQYGYRDFSKLRESQRNIGKKEILNLLKQALTSKSPLSDVLLENKESNRMDTSLSRTGVPRSCYSCNTNIRLKVIVRKSNNEVLWAEAEEDFIDFLFSFLTTPVGSILMLLDGNFSVGCMHNLYNSVKKLDSSCLARSFGTSLLNPKVAPQFGFSRGPIQLNEQATPTYRYGKRAMKKNICCGDGNGVISKSSSLVKNSCPMKLFDPRSPDGKSDVGFVRRPSRFVVRDYLKVSSLVNTPIISLMQEFNIPLDDFKVQEVGIGKTEALKLLGASLTSKTALTDALSDLLKKADRC